MGGGYLKFLESVEGGRQKFRIADSSAKCAKRASGTGGNRRPFCKMCEAHFAERIRISDVAEAQAQAILDIRCCTM